MLDARSIAIWLVGLVPWALGSFALPGCGDIEWHWEEKPAQPIRPIVPPPRPASQPSSTQPSSAPSESPKAGNSSEPTAFPAVPEEQGFHQLVLLSEKALAVPPGVNCVQLTRASARNVGELLAILYLPTGPAGTTHRYTLVYPTLAERASATGWARDLDIAPVEQLPPEPPADAGRTFALGVGLLYATPHAHPNEGDRLRLAEASLARTLNAPDQPAAYRWAAGTIAGAICADRLGDYERAERHLLAAQDSAMPDSFEQMAALYLRARVQVQDGKRRQARQMLTDLLGRFGRFAASEVYDRAGKTLAEIEGGR